MPCYHPLRGYRSRTVNASGKRNIEFSPNQGFRDLPVILPCGQCMGCRLERSRQWAIRCVHEASLHENNCFLTLTYRPENLPPGGTLVKKHFQDFMKLYRKWVGRKIRYFHCGEYGEKNDRPHYHALIFGHDFKDKVHHTTIGGHPLYKSKKLEQLWKHGHALIGSVTFESAAYVARYITKKITGPNAIHHYNEINYETGEILQERIPEYVTMSRRPGIATQWFDKFNTDVFPSDEVILRGKKVKPPKFYFDKLELLNPNRHSDIKAQRMRAAKKPEVQYENSRDRLDVREEIQKINFKELKRNLEK